MTIASFFSRHRARVLLLCALTLLLHFLTIDWLGGHIGPIRTAPPPPPSIITAQLHLAAPDPAAMTATPFPAPKPAPKPAARPAVKAAPKPLAKPDSKPDSEPDSEPDPLTDLP
ncbi:MAG TPA: hypothetical protein VGP06_16115, partial [Janthinobacterium sp.]|nr:hypothetical protein [Janthinobacterium sp.]